MEPIEKIRDILFDEIDSYRSGKSDIDRMRAISDISAQTIYSIRLEMENKRVELEVGKADDEVKKWMAKDFSKISKKEKGK